MSRGPMMRAFLAGYEAHGRFMAAMRRADTATDGMPVPDNPPPGFSQAESIEFMRGWNASAADELSRRASELRRREVEP